jgi:hypothetical protein
LLLPQSRKKSSQTDPELSLGTPDGVRRAEERDRALTARARRRREEIAAERAHFELTRDRITFGVELALGAAMLTVALVLSLLDPSLLPAVLLSGGGSGWLATRSRRRSRRN